MSEPNSNETMAHPETPTPAQQEETPKNPVKVIDTFSSIPQSVPHYGPSNEPSRMTRRKVLGLGLGAAAIVGADVATGGGVKEMIKRIFTMPKRPERDTLKPAVESATIAPNEVDPPIDRKVAKVLKGSTIVNKQDQINKDEINFRRDAKVPVANLNEPTPKDNRVDWDEIKAVNGVVLGKTTSFAIKDALAVEGQAVDEGGQGFYWIKLPVELKSGEKTILYVSRSNKTKNIVVASNTQLIDPPVDVSKLGEVLLPDASD